MSSSIAKAFSIADVRDAAERIAPWAVRTPVISSASIDEFVGAEVFFKPEGLQRTGAFKFRGGMNSLAMLTDEQRAAGVVAYSSGNHAQAVAAAAKLMGSSSVIVMPHDAPAGKLASTRSHGARIVSYDRYTESREDIAGQIAADEGRALIPPYDHWPVIAGQGTAALELFDQVDDLDALVVCVGGGGLLAGCATVAAAVSPDTKLFGVEPEAGDDHRQSREAGERITIDVPRTIADGQATQAPGEFTWPITNALVTDFLAVTDHQIVAAMKLLFEEAKLVAEPSGASAFAGVLNRTGALAECQRIGVTISGSNIAWDRFRDIVS